MNEIMTDSYKKILDIIKETRDRVFKNANEEIVFMYFEIGRYISSEVKKLSYNDSYVEGLTEFLSKEYPGNSGFTKRGLYRMKQFYEMYKDDESAKSLITQLSWSNNLKIMSSCKTKEERLFYLTMAVRERYSVRELSRQIDSAYYERYMLSQQPTSPAIAEVKKQAHNLFLDKYALDFLDLPNSVSEHDLQMSIISNLKDFILEMGKDFTYMGEQYHLQVGRHDYFIDLLFYHRGLSCVVAFDLKIGEFKPEYVGKMNLYLEALDREVKKETENPSVGVILCATKDDEVVEYALSRSLSPTMVSEYELKMIDKELLQKKLREYMELAESAGMSDTDNETDDELGNEDDDKK